jgi:membrane protein
MGRPGRRLVRAALAAAATYTRTAGGQRAAAIAYRVLFSLVPFVALLAAAFELVLGESTQERVVAWLVAAVSLPPELADSVTAAVSEATLSPTLAGAVALAGLLWGASGMMTAIRSAFRAVWAAERDRPYLRGKLLDVGLVFGAGLLVLSAFGTSVVVQVVTEASTRIVRDLGGDGPATERLGSLAQVAASTVLAALAFLLLYRVVPPVTTRLRDALPGAIIAALGFAVASAGFSAYLEYATFDDVYGPLGAVLAFLLLVYVAASIMLYGACVAAAWPAAAEPAAADGGEPLRLRLVRTLRGLAVRDGRP